METQIIPSITGDSQEELNDVLEKVAYFNRSQFDIKDGKFVPTKTLDFNFTITSNYIAIIEAHLMIDNPREWILNYADKVHVILIQVETTDNIDELIKLVKQKGKEVGLVLGPYTEPEALYPYLKKLDMVLVFSANKIGYDGAEFQPLCLEKIKAVSNELKRINHAIPIEVDGGVNLQTIKSMYDAGARLFISGSFVRKANDPKAAEKQLLEKLMS